MSGKSYILKRSEDVGLTFAINSDEFDRIVDDGYDFIVIVTPARRYTASIDDWYDYSWLDVDLDTDVRVMRRAEMSVL